MADFNSTYLGSTELSLFVQSPAEAMYILPSAATILTNTRYYQRVLDSAVGWCYYSTLNALDPTPLSSNTSPNWEGTISDFQVVAAVQVP